MSWLRRAPIQLGLFASGLVLFAATAGPRLLRQSPDPHFVYQAHAWLHGRLDIDKLPPQADDPAAVDTVRLVSGEVVRGRFLRTRDRFRASDGRQLAPGEVIRPPLATTHHNSFPPFPAVLLLPQVLLRGKAANDVLLTVVLAALALPLLFVLLRRFAAAGLSRRSVGDDLWLVAAFAFGSVFYCAAVQGRVWFTAHVVGVVLALLYAWCSLEARHPVAAGAALGLAALTRAPMAFLFPLFLFEAWRMAGGRRNLPAFLRRASLFFAPVVALAALAMLYNYARFDDVLEFGHSYLGVRQQANMESTGMFSYHYLSRNLTVAMTLLPDFSATEPYVTVSRHGLAIWCTTPLLLLLLWPRDKGRLHRPLWITALLVALPTLLYHNSGWVQFGYRFSLDYLVLLFLLLAVGGRPLRRAGKALIIVGVIVNLFGAVTFNRHHQFYRGEFEVVMPH